MELTVTFVVVISALYHLAEASHIENDFNEDVVSSCQMSSGITEAEAQLLKHTRIVQDESNEMQKCFVVCLLRSYGLMQEDKMNTEIMAAVMKKTILDGSEETEAQYRKDIEECNKATGEGKCGSSYNVWRCFFQMSVKMALARVSG